MSFKNKARLAFNALHYPFGKIIHDKHMNGETIVLDFSRMEGCTFTDCEVVFFGIGTVRANNCTLNNCEFSFTGPVGDALQFLTLILKASPGLTERTFPFIRDQIIESLQKELIEKEKSGGVSS